MSLPKKNRLNKNFFKKPPRQRGFFESSALSLKIYKNPSADFKMSVVVPSKNVASAADRNKFKRIIKELVREKLKNSGESPAMIFYVKKNKEKVYPKDIKKQAEFLLKKVAG